MKIKLEGLELVHLQNVRRHPAMKLNIAKDLIIFGLVSIEGDGYKLTEAGEQVLKRHSPSFQMGQNMSDPIGLNLTTKRRK